MNEMGETAQSPVSVRSFPSWLREWLPEVALLLVTTGAGIWAGGRWIDPFGDPGFSWSLAYRLSQGERLYRDIYLRFTPLSPYLLAAGARLFGASASYFLLANWIPAVFAAVLLLRCGRHFLSTFERLALGGVVLASSLFVPGKGRLVFCYYPGVVHAIAFSIGALLLIPEEEERRKGTFAGLLAGLAFCCKQEVGIAAVLALSVAAFVGQPHRLAWLTRVFAGFIAVLLLTAAFVLSCASIDSLRENSRLWPVAASVPAEKASFMKSMTGTARPNWLAATRATIFRDLWRLAALAVAALLLTRERRPSSWLRVAALLTGLSLWWLLRGSSQPRPLPSLSLSMTVAFFVAILTLLSVDLPGRPLLVAFATFAGVVGSRTAFATNVAGYYGGPGHFATALTSVVFLLVFVPRLLFGKRRTASYLRTLIAVVVLAVSARETARGVASLRFARGIPFESLSGRVIVDPPRADLLRAIARNTTPGERVLALPEPNAVDALFHLKNDTPLITAIPGWFDAGIERRIIRRLEESPPDLVILFERSFKEYGSQPLGVGYGLQLIDWCNRHYQIVELLQNGRILRRRQAAEGQQTPSLAALDRPRASMRSTPPRAQAMPQTNAPAISHASVRDYGEFPSPPSLAGPPEALRTIRQLRPASDCGAPTSGWIKRISSRGCAASLNRDGLHTRREF